VQDPNEAEFPEMPNSVRSVIKADYSISIQKMPGIKKGMATLMALHDKRITGLHNHIQKIRGILLTNY